MISSHLCMQALPLCYLNSFVFVGVLAATRKLLHHGLEYVPLMQGLFAAIHRHDSKVGEYASRTV